MKLRSSYANFEEKLTSGLKKDEKYCKFSPEHLTVSKLDLWWDPFVQSRRGIYDLKIYRGVMCHENEE